MMASGIVTVVATCALIIRRPSLTAVFLLVALLWLVFGATPVDQVVATLQDEPVLRAKMGGSVEYMDAQKPWSALERLTHPWVSTKTSSTSTSIPEPEQRHDAWWSELWVYNVTYRLPLDWRACRDVSKESQ